MTTIPPFSGGSDSTGAHMNQHEFTSDPSWPNLHNPAEKAHRAECELSMLRSRIRALIASGRARDGRVSCNVLEQTLEES